MSSSLVPVVTVIGVLLFIAIIIAWVPWRKIGEAIFQNNPIKALIYIEMGEDTDCVAGKYLYSGEKGAFYTYTWRKFPLVTAVPFNYGYKWLHGCRCIRLANPGDAWASYWSKHEVPAEVQKSGHDLNALVKGHVGSELVKTIYGSKKLNWTVVVLMIGACMLGYYFYSNYQATGSFMPGAEPIPIEQPVPPSTEPLG